MEHLQSPEESTQEPIPMTPMRRLDRAVEDEGWIHELLHRVAVGALATCVDGSPALNPNLFVFDPERRAIYLHTAKKGRTRSNLEENPRVAFCVAEMGRLLPAKQAVHFSVEFSSVLVEGRARIIEDGAEARRALDLFMRKYAPDHEPGIDYEGTRDQDLARTSVIEIAIESWSGKAKESDAADAYDYRPPSCPRAV